MENLENLENFKYFCIQCNYKTNNKCSYNKHIQTLKHKRGGANVHYNCDVCKFSSKNKKNYEKHLKSAKHLKNFDINKHECPVCYECVNDNQCFNPPCNHKLCLVCFNNIKN